MLAYLNHLWVLIQQSLLLNPHVFELVGQYQQSNSLVIGVVFLAGMSTLLGQSVVLFVNSVKPKRFFFSIIVNGFLFIISYFIWGSIIGLTGRFLFPVDPPSWSIARLVGLSTAPLVFGFFILIPYLGQFIEKVLSVWSLLILITVIRLEFQTSLTAALICAGLGWIVMWVLTKTLGRPVVALRNRIWHSVANSQLELTAHDILLEFSQGKPFAKQRKRKQS